MKILINQIKDLIKKEKKCMNNDKYQEQEIEHINQIEMANKILSLIKNSEGKA